MCWVSVLILVCFSGVPKELPHEESLGTIASEHPSNHPYHSGTSNQNQTHSHAVHHRNDSNWIVNAHQREYHRRVYTSTSTLCSNKKDNNNHNHDNHHHDHHNNNHNSSTNNFDVTPKWVLCTITDVLNALNLYNL